MPLFSLLRLALKGVRRRPGRTILTVLGLAVLVLIYVSVQSLVATLEINLTGSITSLGGEIDVWSKGASYPLLSRMPESYLTVVQGIPGISKATPVALAVSTLDSDVAVTVGIIPGDLSSLFSYRMIGGSMITGNQSGLISLGMLLAEKIGKGTGDSVQFFSVPFKVVGVYRTDSWADYSAIIPFTVAQQSFGIEGGTSMIIVNTSDSRNIDSIIDQIKTRLPAVEAFRRQEAPSRISPLFSSLQSIASGITVVVTLGAIFGAVNSNLNNLRERARAFAIFKAIGASRGQMIRLILLEALILGSLGALVGLAMSYAILQFLSIPITEGLRVRIELLPSVFAFGGALVVVASFVASLYPALRVARIRPQGIFRFG